MTFTSPSPLTIGSLVLNTTDANGTLWKVLDVDGWDGTTTPTLQMAQKPRQHGAVAGDSFSSGRVITVRGMIRSNTPEQHSLDRDTLDAAVTLAPTLLQVSESGRVRWVMVRRQDQVLFKRINRWTSNFSFLVASEDWRKFGTPMVGATFLPSTSGGLTIPFTIPFTISATLVTGQVNLTNPGNTQGPVRMRIDGPCTGPIVTHVGSGHALAFASSLVLAAGEWLDVDMEAHTVLANGQSSRAGYITSRGWSAFDPGNNSWAFTAAVYDAASMLTVTGTPADD